MAKELAKQLKFNHYSVGDRMGEMAEERGISIFALSELAEKDRAIDDALDSWTETLGETNDDFVIDSRLAFHFIPDALKVFLDVDPHVGAKRIYGDTRPDEQENVSEEETYANTLSRWESEKKRYQQYYGIDHAKPDNYEVVIDTSKLSVKEVVDKILTEVRKRM